MRTALIILASPGLDQLPGLAEVIHRRGPWRSFEAVEYATLEWVDWFNNRRLLAPIGNIPPAEAEERYYTMLDDTPWPHNLSRMASDNPAAVQQRNAARKGRLWSLSPSSVGSESLRQPVRSSGAANDRLHQ